MFWFVFISIILFIIFLIILLFSSRSSGDMTQRRLREKESDKRRASAKKTAAARREEIIAQNRSLKAERAKLKEVIAQTAAEKAATAAAEKVSIPRAEEPFILEEEPFVMEALEEQPLKPETPQTSSPAAKESFATPSAWIDVEAECRAPLEVGPIITEVAKDVPKPESVTVSDDAQEGDYDYPPFDHTRAMVEFGLPKQEADLFIVDLIEQVEAEMPGLEAAVAAHDSKKIEDVSHMIKGSATNLGTGGIADVLIDFNTYMKKADDASVIAKHMRNLQYALGELKLQFQ